MSSLQILVLADEPVPAPEEPDDQMEDQGIKDAAVRFRRRVTAKPADMQRLAGDMDKVMPEVETLLEGRTERKVAGLALNEVQVMLGISAEGSIGVVTAGMEASITLCYSRSA
jgi:hypothetical protein